MIHGLDGRSCSLVCARLFAAMDIWDRKRNAVCYGSNEPICSSDKKVCPIHGEVSNDEIVPGFEYAKNQYVVVEPDEIEKLRAELCRGRARP